MIAELIDGLLARLQSPTPLGGAKPQKGAEYLVIRDDHKVVEVEGPKQARRVHEFTDLGASPSGCSGTRTQRRPRSRSRRTR